MKKSKIIPHIFFSICFLVSCSSGEPESPEPVPEKASLSFAVVLNDLVAKNSFKQQFDDLTVCSDALPAFVEVVVSQNGEMVAGNLDDPLRINLNSGAADSGEYFTEESSTLKLDPGLCTLEYFTVHDQEENLIWMAPISTGEEGDFSNLVADPLPLDINLVTGSQQYADVNVLCFDDRNVNLYGYVFTEFTTVEAIEFCILGTFCDEAGRQDPAIDYAVSVWEFSGDPENPQGELLHDHLISPSASTDEGTDEMAHEPLCFSLPDSMGEQEYYFEISLESSGNSENRLIRSGLITDSEIKELFIGEEEVEYYHFRQGNCNLNDSPELFNIIDI